MSNKVIVFWGFLIVSLVLGIYAIGYYKKEELTIIKNDKFVKDAINKYIENEDIIFPFETTSEYLTNLGILEEKIIINNKECIAIIKASDKDNYDINYNCKNNNRE